MAHQSENANRLSVRRHVVSDVAALPPVGCEADVWLFVLPHGRSVADAEPSAWFARLRRFAESLPDDAVLAILTSPADAAETATHLSDVAQFQLWVAVKLAKPIERPGALPAHHAALVILSKYRAALRHTKMRIGYSYCPACDKTTKDYGGKKHTYHEYGTLMSDVWRDLEYAPGAYPTELIDRLADLFGLAPHRRLHVVDLRQAKSLQPGRPAQQSAARTPRRRTPRIESKLVCGDVLDTLRALPANAIDFCFADPPYNLAKRYDAWDDAIAASDYLSWCDAWLDELARVLRPGCTCAVLNIPVLAVRHFEHLGTRLQYQSWIAWEGLSLPVRMIMPAHYAIVCFSKGPPRALPGLTRSAEGSDEALALTALCEDYCLRPGCLAARRRAGVVDRAGIGDLWWDIHRLKHNARRVDHPCQLPPALMRRLIALYTAPGEIVLDPFNGAGTTSLCAAQLGRRYLGIELSEQYHALALRRHEALGAGGDPFAKSPGRPAAKNSRVARIGGIKYAVPKKTLQMEVKRVAELLGRLPTRDELTRHGQYPIGYYDQYFISWGEVCAAARTTGMREVRGK